MDEQGRRDRARNYFLQILLFLLGVVLAVYAALKHSNTLLTIIGIVAGVGAVVGVIVWLAYDWSHIPPAVKKYGIGASILLAFALTFALGERAGHGQWPFPPLLSTPMATAQSLADSSTNAVTSTAAATAQSLADASTNWVTTLEYRIPISNWTVGTHQYTLDAQCVGEPPETVTDTFTVSDSYPLLPQDVYLRWAGLRKEKTAPAEPVDGINPAQPTVAVVVAVQDVSHDKAIASTTSCSGTFSLDDGAPISLVAQAPFQH